MYLIIQIVALPHPTATEEKGSYFIMFITIKSKNVPKMVMTLFPPVKLEDILHHP